MRKIAMMMTVLREGTVPSLSVKTDYYIFNIGANYMYSINKWKNESRRDPFSSYLLFVLLNAQFPVSKTPN